MVVTIDSEEILGASNPSYKGNFTGAVIMDNIGSFSYENIGLCIEHKTLFTVTAMQD